MVSEKALRAIRGFVAHGVEPEKEVGNQVKCFCPFSNKEGKFFVNPETLLWDSKTAGVSGNFQAFLKLVGKLNVQNSSSKQLGRLAKDRDLPVAAFHGWNVGWDGEQYTIPVTDAKGRVRDLRRYKLKGKPYTTPGAENWLLGHDKLKRASSEPVYLCEGEWDAIALSWLLKRLDQDGTVVGAPGANTFKKDWVGWFRGRDVIVLYDNDEAGRQGEELVKRSLQGQAKSLRFLEWPLAAPEGFDVRDWIVRGVTQLKTPRACWRELQKLLQEGTRSDGEKVARDVKKRTGGKKLRKGRGRVRPPMESLLGVYDKHHGGWLELPSDDVLPVLFGTVLANRLQGDPLWVLLVAPPGDVKSELIMSLHGCEEVHAVNGLTPHVLVSGMNWSGGADPSLAPLLDGKVMAMKDFTSVLSMHPTSRDEIFGQLRDMYDGSYAKMFGNGVVRKYNSRFGIIAGVTPAVDGYASLHAGLGERFLKYRFERSGDLKGEEERILAAMGNSNKEVQMRDEMRAAAMDFLASREGLPIPTVSAGATKQIVALAMLASRLRGTVPRETYNQDMMITKATHEIGTRLSKQLLKLCRGIAWYYDSKEVDQRCLRVAAQVAIDSCTDKVAEIVAVLSGLRGREAYSTKEVCELSGKLTLSTVFRTLQDLQLLGIAQQRGEGRSKRWVLTKKIRKLLEDSGVVW